MTTRPRRAVVRFVVSGLAAAAALGGLLACTSADPSSPLSSSSSSGSSSGSACPDDLPAACPANVPSYTKDVAPVIQQACTSCHGPGGQQSSRPLVDYASASANRSAVLNQVHACRMPPSGAPPLPEAGRKALLTWLVCGAPNN